MKLKDKVVLVTGAGSGIGKAIALAFAKEGAKVAVNDEHPDEVETTLAEIGKLGGEGLGVVADVSRVQEVKDMFSRVIARYGTLDILVNNAGIAVLTDRVKANYETAVQQLTTQGKVTISLEATRYMTDEAWDRMLAVHLNGTFYCTREALNIMEEKGVGKIINMASICGTTGCAGAPDYSAAKGAILGFTKSVAKEVIGRGIYVNAIAPGYIDTSLLNIMTRTMFAMVTAQTPLGRLGVAEEVVSVAVFLASDESSYVVGQVISPNGGMVI